MSIISNTAWLTLCSVVSDVVAFLFYVTIARLYGAQQMGDYAFAFALIAFFAFGIELGLRPLITRKVSKDRSITPSYLGNVFVFQAILSVLFIFLLLILISIKSYSVELITMLFLAYVHSSIRSIGISYLACLEAIEQMKTSAVLLLIERISICSIGFIFIFMNYDLEIILISHVFGSLLFLTLCMHYVKKYFGKLNYSFDVQFIKALFIAAIPFLGASALNVLYSRIDIIMLHYFIGEDATGLYAVAIRCIESTLVVAPMVGFVIYPILSRLGEEDISERSRVFFSSLKWLSFIGIAGTMSLILAGDHMMSLLLGEAYGTSGTLIRYMSALFLIGCIKVPYWRLLFASHREISQLRAQCVSIGMNVVLNVALIPKYGVFGAVWASIISETILVILFHQSCRKMVSDNYISSAVRLLFAFGIPLTMGLLIRSNIQWGINIAMSLSLFIFFLVLFDLIKKKDRELMHSYFKQIMEANK